MIIKAVSTSCAPLLARLYVEGYAGRSREVAHIQERSTRSGRWGPFMTVPRILLRASLAQNIVYRSNQLMIPLRSALSSLLAVASGSLCAITARTSQGLVYKLSLRHFLCVCLSVTHARTLSYKLPYWCRRSPSHDFVVIGCLRILFFSVLGGSVAQVRPRTLLTA